MTQVPEVVMDAEAFEDTCLLRFPAFEDIRGFTHAVTTRPWNMATHCGAEPERVPDRRLRLCEHLGLRFEHLTMPEQVHEANVVRVLPSDVGAGRRTRQTAIRFVDGLVCALPDVPLMQLSADCPIIVIIEPDRCILGTAHASWRGTLAQIATELVRQLSREFEIDPGNLLAGICPCVAGAEYEVGEAVRRIALARLPDAERFFQKIEETWRFDLRAANVDQLLRSGIEAGNIRVASTSTMSDERFYSYRRDGSDTGRFALIAGFGS